METKTNVVIFKKAMEQYAQPDIYICDAAKADDIQALLETVENEGCGPIDSLSYTEFVEQIGTITLAQLKERFEDELAASQEEGEEAGSVTRWGGGANSSTDCEKTRPTHRQPVAPPQFKKTLPLPTVC